MSLLSAGSPHGHAVIVLASQWLTAVEVRPAYKVIPISLCKATEYCLLLAETLQTVSIFAS